MNSAAASFQAQWILVDSNSLLLKAGDRSFNGVSLRRHVNDPLARSLLFPALQRALSGGAPVSRHIAESNSEWVVEIMPIRAPLTGSIVAALGIYSRPGQPIPPKPEVGAWEWRIKKGGVPPTLCSYWDETMFRLYELPPASKPGSTGAFTTPDWLDHVVAPPDRLRMKQKIDLGIETVTPDLHTIVYEVTAAYGTEFAHPKRLRLAGRAHRPDGDSTVWLRGVVHVASPLDEERTPGLDEVRADDFLRSTRELIPDVALCLLDTLDWRAYDPSPAWETLAITNNDGLLLTAIQSPNVDEVKSVLRTASQSGKTESISTLLRTETGEDLPALLTAMRASANPRYVLCRIQVPISQD